MKEDPDTKLNREMESIFREKGLMADQGGFVHVAVHRPGADALDAHSPCRSCPMTEHPILFSGAMVRAILDGRKTMTRRIVKPRKDRDFGCHLAPCELAGEINSGNYRNSACGQPGDTLWVRETCSAEEPIADTAADRALDGLDGVRYAADGHFEPIENTAASADAWCALHAYRGLRGAIVPAIYMPRWASRITLRIKSVRVERLQAISEDDAISEGADPVLVPPDGGSAPHVEGFRELWDSLNQKRGAGWGKNPWVWVIEFERVEPKP